MSVVANFELKPVTRQNLSESITGSLRNAIFAGMFMPGQRLAEAQLAGQLKVSRAPIREALALLEQEGLVHRSPSGGATVSRLSRQDADEICTLRGTLEILALRLAMDRGTETMIAELAANIRETERAADPQQLAQLDLHFHEIILRAAGNGRVLSTWMNLRSQIQLIMVQKNVVDANSPRSTLVAHRAVLAAVQAGNADGAVALVERQLQSQHAWIANSFEVADAV